VLSFTVSSHGRYHPIKAYQHHTRPQDAAAILARGYSAQFLGANVLQSLTVRRKDEIEKDLRHIQAYCQAVQ
jgi:hypothetical protein